MSHTEETKSIDTQDVYENDAKDETEKDRSEIRKRLSELVKAMKEGNKNQRMRLYDYFREYGLFVGMAKAAAEAVKRVLVAPFVIVAAGLQTMGFNLEHGREYERSVQADRMRERDRAGRAYDREAEKNQSQRSSEDPKRESTAKEEKVKSQGEKTQTNETKPEKKPALSEAEKKAIMIARNIESYKRGVANLPLDHFGKKSNSIVTMFDRETSRLCFALPVQETYESVKKGEFVGLVNNVADLEKGVAFVNLKDLVGSDATKIMDVYNALEKNSEKEPKTEKEIKDRNKLTLYRAVSSAIALHDMHMAIAQKNYPVDMIKAGSLSFVFSPKKDGNGAPVADTERIEVMYDGKKIGVLPWMSKSGETLEKMEQNNIGFTKTSSQISRMVNKYFKENGIDCIDLGLTKEDLKKREQEATVPLLVKEGMVGEGHSTAVYMAPNPLIERLEKKMEEKLKWNIEDGLKKDPAKLLGDIKKYFIDNGKQYSSRKYDFVLEAVRQCKTAMEEKKAEEEKSHGATAPEQTPENEQTPGKGHPDPSQTPPQPEKPESTKTSPQPEPEKPEGSKKRTYVNIHESLSIVDKEMMHELFFASFEKDGQNNVRRDPDDFLHVYSQHSDNGEAAINAAKRMLERDEVYESYDDMMDDIYGDPDFVKDVQENAAREQSEPQQGNSDGVGVFETYDIPDGPEEPDEPEEDFEL